MASTASAGDLVPAEAVDPGYPSGGMSLDGFLNQGHWWSPLTYQFVHVGFGHLFFNLVFLWIAGRYLQMLFGNRAVVLLYLLAGFAGAGLHFVANELPILLRVPWAEAQPQLSYLVGSSGAVCGFICALGLARPYLDLFEPFRSVLPLRLSARNLAIGVVVATGILIFVDWIRDHRGIEAPLVAIAHHVHLGGAIAGGLMGWWLAYRLDQPHGQRNSESDNWKEERRSERRTNTEPVLQSRVQESEPEWALSSLAPKTDQAEMGSSESREEFVARRLDPILDKISEHGYGSLTEEERELLEEGRRRL